MWFSQQYKTTYQDKYKVIKSHRNALFSNGDIYDTLIGMFNIHSERYQAVNDLTSQQYFLEEDNAYTRDRRILFTDKSNYVYQQEKNIAILKDTKCDLRIIPQEVNSIGKLKDIWYYGYRAFEVDVHYGYDDQDNFVMGYNQDEVSNMSFEQFIASIPYFGVKKICVSVKNLNQNNYSKILQRLKKLNSKFSLKEKLIIETETSGSFLSKFHEAGWYLSYKLPTNNVLNYLENNKTKEMLDLAKSVFKQIILQRFSAVSFDYRLYPFVKNYLERLLPDKIVYHIWDLTAKLYDANLRTILNQKNYYTDKRIKTILLPFKSLFDL